MPKMEVMELLRFTRIIFSDYLLLSLFLIITSSCGRIETSTPSETKCRERAEFDVKIKATEEEIEFTKSNGISDYESTLRNAYALNKGSLIKLINMRSTIIWDGIAADSFGSNFRIIVRRWGDYRLKEFALSNSDGNLKLLRDLTFPYDDKGDRLYKNIFPKTYQIIGGL